MLDEGILSIVPPPWRLLPKGGYINDVTGEMSESHPMEKLLHQRNVPNENVNEVGENHRPGASAVKFPSMALPIPLEETPSVGLMDATERSLHEEVRSQNAGVNCCLKTPVQFTEYRCTWSERNLFGNSLVFGLTIHFFQSDHSCIIKFDDVDAHWRFEYSRILHYSLDDCGLGILCWSVNMALWIDMTSSLVRN